MCCLSKDCVEAVWESVSLTNVVCTVADVGRDLLHSLVVQNSLLLSERIRQLQVDSPVRSTIIQTVIHLKKFCYKKCVTASSAYKLNTSYTQHSSSENSC